MTTPTKYAICYTDNEPQNIIKHIKSTDEGLLAALDILKTARRNTYDNGSFIAPIKPAERDAFPYRNKIGPINPSDDSNYWGYRFRLPGTHTVVAMWVEKLEVGAGIRTLREELGDVEVKGRVKECECEYGAYVAALIGLDRAYGRRWDEGKRGFRV